MRKVAALLLIALGVMGVTSAAAFASTARLQVSPGRVRPGGEVDISGTGCAPGVSVDVELRSGRLRSTGLLVSGGEGEFKAQVTIPPEARGGRAWIKSTCQTSAGAPQALEATVLVTRPPLVVTWVNLLFGIGTALAVSGFGLGMRRKTPHGGRPRMPRRRRRRRRRSMTG